MKVGDLVRCSPNIYDDDYAVGVVLEVRHASDANIDYRSPLAPPPAILVYSTVHMTSDRITDPISEWYDKNDLELLSER
jgi:hypothetical protein